MNKGMKVPFTIFQTALTAASIFILCGCIGCDSVIMLFAADDYGSRAVVFNGILSVIALLLSLIFILKPSVTGFVKGSKAGTDPVPALKAVRTYICFVSLDAAAVLAMMLFGVVFKEQVEKYILICVPAVFLVGAVKYFFDIRRIGIQNDADDDE